MQPPADLLTRVRTLRPQDPKLLADLRAEAQRNIRAAEAAGAHPCGVGEADLASDLFALDDLPGVGPGLLWKLRQNGVLSLRDLAHADPVDLGRRLGAIGKLVAVGPWIDFARKRLLERAD